MGYPTAAELVAQSSVPELTNLDSAHQDQLYRSSVAAVEEYTNQQFLFDAGLVISLEGTGGRTLFLPRRLEALTDLSVSYSGIGPDDVEVVEHERLVIKPMAGIGNYYEKTLRELDGSLPLTFTFGPSTVQVAGDWGWPECPTDVADAIRVDMEDQALADANQLSDTVRSARALGLRDISQGNLSAILDIAPGLSYRAQRMLTPFIWFGRVGAVI